MTTGDPSSPNFLILSLQEIVQEPTKATKHHQVSATFRLEILETEAENIHVMSDIGCRRCQVLLARLTVGHTHVAVVKFTLTPCSFLSADHGDSYSL